MRRSHPSWILFWFVKAAEKQVFTFLQDPFMEATKVLVVTCKNCEKTVPTLPSAACILPCIHFTHGEVLHSFPRNIEWYTVTLLSTRPTAETSMTQDDVQKVAIYYRDTEVLR